MEHYTQGYGSPAMGTVTQTHMTLNQVCKLLRAAKPLVLALSIVIGLLGVTLIVRYLWTKNTKELKEKCKLKTSASTFDWQA